MSKVVVFIHKIFMEIKETIWRYKSKHETQKERDLIEYYESPRTFSINYDSKTDDYDFKA